jgi:hypothetical protein
MSTYWPVNPSVPSYGINRLLLSCQAITVDKPSLSQRGEGAALE